MSNYNRDLTTYKLTFIKKDGSEKRHFVIGCFCDKYIALSNHITAYRYRMEARLSDHAFEIVHIWLTVKIISDYFKNLHHISQ